MLKAEQLIGKSNVSLVQLKDRKKKGKLKKERKEGGKRLLIMNSSSESAL